MSRGRFRKRALAAPLLALPLSACPAPTVFVGAGISPLPAVPDPNCITATIGATEGVASVQSGKRDDEVFHLLPHFGKVTEHRWHWTYLVEREPVFVEVAQIRRTIDFRHYSPQHPDTPAPSLAALQAVIERVQARLVAMCGLPARRQPRKHRQ